MVKRLLPSFAFGKGFTLTEVMLVVAITGIISSSMYLAIQKSIQAQLMADALTTIQQGAFSSFDVASRLIRQASAASIVIDRYDSNQPPWSRLTFLIPTNGRTIIVSQRGQTLYIGTVPFFKGLRRVTFAYPDTTGPNVMTMSMTFEKTVGTQQTKAIQLFIQRIKIQNL